MRPLIFFLLVSCSIVRVYNMKEIDSELTKNRDNLIILQSKIIESARYKLGMMEQINERLNTVKEMGLVSKVKEIAAIEKKLKDLIGQNLQVINTFPYRSRSKIKSDEEEYKEIEQKYNQLQALNTRINELVKLHGKEEEQLKELLKEKNIYRIDPSQLQAQIRLYREKTNSQLINAAAKIEKAKQSFTGDLEKQNILTRMKLSLHKISTKKEELLKYLEQLNSKIEGKKNFWVAPGMLGHDYVGAIQEKVSQLNSLVAEFQTIQAELLP